MKVDRVWLIALEVSAVVTNKTCLKVTHTHTHTTHNSHTNISTYTSTSLVPRPSPLSAHYTRASCAHADSYARGRPGLKHHVR